MGVIYYAICRDCGVYQDLDKFYFINERIRDRDEALKLSEELTKPHNSFRAALLVAFMGAHMGHSCTVTTDHNEPDETNGLQLDPSNVWGIDKD